MEMSNNKASTKTSTAFSLLAILLAAAAFKDELKAIHLIFPPVSLFFVFVVAAVFIAILLILYLIIDLKDGTFLENKFNTQKFQVILDHAFLLFIFLVIFFSIATAVIFILNFSFGSSAITVLSGISLGIMAYLRTTYDRYQYRKYLASLSDEERFLKLKILKAENYLATINNPQLRKDISQDIRGLRKQLDRIAAAKTKR